MRMNKNENEDEDYTCELCHVRSDEDRDTVGTKNKIKWKNENKDEKNRWEEDGLKQIKGGS